MTNTLIHGIIDALSGSVSKEVIVISDLYDPDSGTARSTSGCRTNPRSESVYCDTVVYYRKYNSGSFHFTSDHTGV